jgi:hypothetical protein
MSAAGEFDSLSTAIDRLSPCTAQEVDVQLCQSIQADDGGG